MATSPVDVDRIDIVNDTQDQDVDESDNFQSPDIRFTKPRLKKKKKVQKMEEDMHLYPESQAIFPAPSKNIYKLF